jgi:peptidoglycan hydrolase CwlO-like protein
MFPILKLKTVVVIVLCLVLLFLITCTVLNFIPGSKTIEYKPMDNPENQKIITQLQMDTTRLNAKIKAKEEQVESIKEFSLNMLQVVSQSKLKVEYYRGELDKIAPEVNSMTDEKEIENLINKSYHETHGK